jgi:hypothetical protein
MPQRKASEAGALRGRWAVAESDATRHALLSVCEAGKMLA